MTVSATFGSWKGKLKHKEYEPQKLTVLNKQATKEAARRQIKGNFDIQNILLWWYHGAYTVNLNECVPPLVSGNSAFSSQISLPCKLKLIYCWSICTAERLEEVKHLFNLIWSTIAPCTGTIGPTKCYELKLLYCRCVCLACWRLPVGPRPVSPTLHGLRCNNINKLQLLAFLYVVSVFAQGISD